VIKTFEKFNQDFDDKEDYLIILLDDDGIEYNKVGSFEEGFGIYDESGNMYSAGVDVNGKVYGCGSFENGFIKLNSDEIEFIPGLENALSPGFNYFDNKK
jgi:hypothetical protein